MVSLDGGILSNTDHAILGHRGVGYIIYIHAPPQAPWMSSGSGSQGLVAPPGVR